MSINVSSEAERSRASNVQRTQPLRHALHRAEAAVGAASPLDAWRRLGVLGRGRKSVWATVATVLVLAGVVASVFGARAVARSQSEHRRLAFHLVSDEIASALKLSLQHEEDLVVGASAFFTGNPNASPADFDRWAESVHAMQRYPELQNIGLVALVPASRLAAFKARLAANPVRPPGSTGRPIRPCRDGIGRSPAAIVFRASRHSQGACRCCGADGSAPQERAWSAKYSAATLQAGRRPDRAGIVIGLECRRAGG